MTKLHGDAFTDIYFGREMGTRLVAGGHSLVSLWKNIFAVVTRGLPWWPLAAYALARWRRAGTRERVGMTVAGLWLMEIVLTMAVPSVRYDRYVLPAYPALALLAGHGMDMLLTERARQALPRIVLTLTVAAGLLFALVPIQLHTYGRPNYVFARQLLDAYNVGDAVAFVDPECTPGLSRAPEHWSIRAAVVYYLDRGLVNYSNPENAIRDGHRFAVVLETQRDFIEPWGYEPVVKLDSRRWLMSRTPDRPGGSPAQ